MDLFEDPAGTETLEPGAVVLRSFARAAAPGLLADLGAIVAQAPLRQMVTPGGKPMSVAMTCCGALGWVSDRAGYRYVAHDPATGRPWPAMPPAFADLATGAAASAGFPGFAPDACLINRYVPGTRLTLHQDRDEADFTAPIVSVSFGVPAVFLWGGATRGAPARRIRLAHGDVIVWGGPARLNFHGIAPLAGADHPATGSLRWNLTFRKAG